MLFKSIVFLVASLTVVSYTSAATDKVICFYASWAVYRNGNGAFKPENVDPNLCTHVMYAFLGVNTDGTLKLLDPWNDINLEGLSKISNLKVTNPNLKVLLSIGGWNAGHGILDFVAASTSLRAAFIQSCLQMFQQYNYDGLDIDWEYPLDSDKANFVTLLQELRAAFDPKGYVLSVTTSANPLSSYDVPAISKVVDLINIMTYDFHLPSEGYTGHNAPLYGSPSVNSSVYSWLNQGASPDKLTISVPFYGHSYSLSDPNNYGIGVPATTGIGGAYTQSPGVLGFNEITEFYNDWTREWDADTETPYRHSGANWVSYDDEESLGIKAKYAKAIGLAGLAVWSLDTDDFHGASGTDHALLRAINNNL